MRLFVSIPVSGEVREVLGQAQRLLRTELADIDLRFQNLEQSHVTLRFLGEVPESALPDCRSAVDAAARSVPPFTLRTARFGVFPNPARPGVLWLGMAGETGVLEHMHQVLTHRLAVNVPPADAPRFRPHLTLCRVQQTLSINDRKRIAGLLSLAEPVPAVSWQVGSVQLISSRLQSGGAVHTVIEDQPLTGEAG